MTSIRGAITVTENSRDAILEATSELLHAIIEANNLAINQIIDLIFTTTNDVTAVYPAAAARSMGITEAGLMCMQEMAVPGSLRRCIRLLMHVNQAEKTQKDMHFVYLREAVSLRPDLAGFAVAIDGPSGAGKSTVARNMAQALNMLYVDTGAMYRAVAYYNLSQETDIRDESQVEASLKHIDIALRHDEKGQRLLLNGSDVTEALRSQAVAEEASVVAQYPSVRKKLVALQRKIAQSNPVVMDGRDIATQVLPWAQVKIYLDASPDERARRRVLDLREKGFEADFNTIREQVQIRDERDMNRPVSPLIRSEDAIYIDSSALTEEQVLAQVTALTQERQKALGFTAQYSRFN